MAVQEYLPGSPTKRLVKLVRMILRKYGIKPRGQRLMPHDSKNS